MFVSDLRKSAKKLDLQIAKSANNQRLGPQITNSQIAHGGRSKKLTILVILQVCGFAICGTYLRTIHLCNHYIFKELVSDEQKSCAFYFWWHPLAYI